ncbi:MAG: DUF2225 domain-containing protein [Oscillospiraceae bacterium]|nr:DUF2225 domain-containing protein [Oscillospiraceae bacterium]
MASLYPEGHKGGYELQLKEDPAYMSQGSFHCPACGVTFKALKIRDIKLIPLKVGELRTQYKDIEPLYYEITSCPNCRYSAQTPMFDKVSATRKKLIRDALAPFMPELAAYSETLTPDAVFERFYLALQCYGVGFADKELLEAGIWLKLSNLYSDAKDADMEAYAAGEAQKSYLAAFTKCRIPPNKFPSLNLRIGMLSIKIGDIRTARDFLYKVKVDASSTRLQKDTADDYINDLKGLEGEQG